jgi:phage gp36-like protein
VPSACVRLTAWPSARAWRGRNRSVIAAGAPLNDSFLEPTMSTQTYCTLADLEAVWNPLSLLESVDDDGNATLSPAEEALVEQAIERAAGKMHAYLLLRYDVADLTNSVWCRDCNAVLAAYFLATRTGSTAPDGLYFEYSRYLTDLASIRDGLLVLPEVVSRIDHGPSVSNYHVDLSGHRIKIERIDPQ